MHLTSMKKSKETWCNRRGATKAVGKQAISVRYCVPPGCALLWIYSTYSFMCYIFTKKVAVGHSMVRQTLPCWPRDHALVSSLPKIGLDDNQNDFSQGHQYKWFHYAEFFSKYLRGQLILHIIVTRIGLYSQIHAFGMITNSIMDFLWNKSSLWTFHLYFILWGRC